MKRDDRLLIFVTGIDLIFFIKMIFTMINEKNSYMFKNKKYVLFGRYSNQI